MSVVSESLRQLVRDRAGQRCEYCLLPENEGSHPFHVEHIVSRKHGGASVLDNLAWACFPCNVSKGPDLSSIDPETGELTVLYNPRQHLWNDHFEMINGEIKGRTPVGRVTAQLLQFNSEKQIALRRKLVELKRW
jgi:hypothetical protein